MGRLAPLMEVLIIEPDDATIQIAMQKFENEFNSALILARQRKANLLQILRLDASDDATRMADAIERICDIRLADFDMSGFDGIIERLSQWLNGIEETDNELGDLFLELIEFSIRNV